MDERQVILDTAQGIANLKGMPVEQVLAEATLEDALLYIGALQAGYIMGMAAKAPPDNPMADQLPEELQRASLFAEVKEELESD